MKVIEKIKKIANTLTGDAKDFADAVVAMFEELEGAQTDVTLDDVKKEISALMEQYASNEEVAEKIAAVRESIMREVRNTASNPNALSEDVKRQVLNAIAKAGNKAEALRAIDGICRENGITLKKTKNDVTGLTYADVIDYSIAIKQDDSDEVYDALYKTRVSKMFYAELDDTDQTQIAKQWGRTGEKDVQALAANGKEIATANIYKMQRIANEDMDDAELNNELPNLIAQVSGELRKAVKAGIVRAILIGDTINAEGKKITKFETIGTKGASDIFTTIVNPEVAAQVTITDLARLAEAVKTDKKWLFISNELLLSLREFSYAAGGTPTLLSEDELAAKIGVEKIIKKDYLASVDGLHAIVLDPSQYWVREKKETDIAFPQYERNAKGFLYELNAGGAVRGIQSSAVLKEA